MLAIGQLDGLFMGFAELKGPEYEECIRLNKYLSEALDSPVSQKELRNVLKSLQEKLKKLRDENKGLYVSKYKIWSEMEIKTEQFCKKLGF